MLEKFLDQTVERKASDLYLKSDALPMLRINGELQAIAQAALSVQDLEKCISELLTSEQMKRFAEEKEFNMAYKSAKGGRFRVNIYFQRGTLGIVFRLVTLEIPTIESLHLPLKLKEIALMRQGMFIVVGPTGSGKSTTLASIIDYRNANARDHIITIEDPIEYIYQDRQSIVSQREVGLDTLSFDNALKNALRQAPDVISIGEIRDLETATTALSMAETGHLVFATLHASNTFQSLERLVSIFTAEKEQQLLMMLAMNLKGILAQRLIPLKSGEGRVVATELLVVNSHIKELIRANQISEIVAILRRGDQEGMHSFDQNIYAIYEQGLISENHALGFSDNQGEIKMRMKGFAGAIKQV